jgi:hypothetical protein
VITYHSTQNQVRFDDWQRFKDYLDDEGLSEIAAQHVARGLPRSGFVERYNRVGKALVQVGPSDGGGLGKPQGLPLELVELEG